MKLKSLIFTLIAAIGFGSAAADYVPSPQVRRSQKEFAADRFGIFIHWGLYSLFAQGEWFLNYGVRDDEYSKSARAFYPVDFNAAEWVDAIKDSGARYITITSRHHDGFSMFKTAESDYNIVDGTPFGRDILKELSDECQRRDIKLHLYYSQLDWHRTDYPMGRTGHETQRDSTRADWPAYYSFMNRQLTELLTGYGPIRAIWFDGYWDHDEDSVPFDWQLAGQYELIHRLQPGCLVANNHHEDLKEGEDIQIFERDVPGENTAGYSTQQLARAVPLETCQTMNGMWGYKVRDTNYKSSGELIRLLARCSGMGANLLLNIGPQPNGELPAVSLERLKDIGVWLRANGEVIYGTEAGDIPPQPWGVTTRKENRLFVLIFPEKAGGELRLPLNCKVKSAVDFSSRKKLPFSRDKKSGDLLLPLPEMPENEPIYIVELTTR